MPTLLIRNISPELHAQLKAQAKAHRRSLAGEVLEVIERGISAPVPPTARPLPPPIPLRHPTTMEETLRFIDEGLDQSSTPDAQ